MPKVDLWINTVELADTFEHMRTWLDHEDCVPLNFDQSVSEPGKIHIHVSSKKTTWRTPSSASFRGPGSDPALVGKSYLR